jgi:hypothetical protein
MHYNVFINSLMPMLMEFSGHGTGKQCFTGAGPWGCPDIPGQAMDVDMNQFWTMIDWGGCKDKASETVVSCEGEKMDI